MFFFYAFGFCTFFFFFFLAGNLYRLVSLLFFLTDWLDLVLVFSYPHVINEKERGEGWGGEGSSTLPIFFFFLFLLPLLFFFCFFLDFCMRVV